MWRQLVGLCTSYLSLKQMDLQGKLVGAEYIFESIPTLHCLDFTEVLV